jgi:hypothetical protein
MGQAETGISFFMIELSVKIRYKYLNNQYIAA